MHKILKKYILKFVYFYYCNHIKLWYNDIIKDKKKEKKKLKKFQKSVNKVKNILYNEYIR